MPHFYGTRRVPQMMQKIRLHRALVRASGNMALEASWDEIEQFIDFLYAEVGKRDATQFVELPSEAA
ncbi:hypothetical protein [Paracoccus ravus]|uniref:hypothetical protein n=1 Tax=Paracoccus ravus TaxID=2447760 RepID=UPI00106E93FC|nr:hypothetical protein [Paracoccus ravus]